MSLWNILKKHCSAWIKETLYHLIGMFCALLETRALPQATDQNRGQSAGVINTKQYSVNFRNLKNIDLSLSQCKASFKLNLGLLNARSVTGKEHGLRDFNSDNSINILSSLKHSYVAMI